MPNSGVVSTQGFIYLGSTGNGLILDDDCLCCTQTVSCAEEVPYVEPFTDGSASEPCWEYLRVEFDSNDNNLTATTANIVSFGGYARRTQITFPSVTAPFVNNNSFSVECDFIYPEIPGNDTAFKQSPAMNFSVGTEGLTISGFSNSFGGQIQTQRGRSVVEEVFLRTFDDLGGRSLVTAPLPVLGVGNETHTVKFTVSVVDEDFGVLRFVVEVDGVVYINWTEANFPLSGDTLRIDFVWPVYGGPSPNADWAIKFDDLTIDASS
jgi:hypothetical protein